MGARKTGLKFLPAASIGSLVLNMRMPDDAVRRILVVALTGGDDARELPPAEEVIVTSILDEIASYDARYKRDVERHRARQKAYYERHKPTVTPRDGHTGDVTGNDGHNPSVTESDGCDGGTERNGTDVPNRGTVPPKPPKGGDTLTVTSSRFVPPSAEEAAAYFAERGAPPGEAVRFCDFYASKGWKVGRSSMKDWRAAVRNWLRGLSEDGSSRRGGVPQKNVAAPPAQPDPFEYRGPQDPAEIAAAMRAAETAPAAPQNDELPPDGPAK